MAKLVQKHGSLSPKKLVFLISCAGLLGAVLITGRLWASSSYNSYSLSPSHFSIASNWSRAKIGIVAGQIGNASEEASRVSPLESSADFINKPLGLISLICELGLWVFS